MEISNLKSPGQAESTDSTNPDRRAAEWTLLIGGTISIKENGELRGMNTGRDRPDGAFELTQVSLDGNPKVSDASLERLADDPKLIFVDVRKTKVTEAGVKKLSAAMPGCKIDWDGGVIEGSQK